MYESYFITATTQWRTRTHKRTSCLANPTFPHYFLAWLYLYCFHLLFCGFTCMLHFFHLPQHVCLTSACYSKYHCHFKLTISIKHTGLGLFAHLLSILMCRLSLVKTALFASSSGALKAVPLAIDFPYLVFSFITQTSKSNIDVMFSPLSVDHVLLRLSIFLLLRWLFCHL